MVVELRSKFVKELKRLPPKIQQSVYEVLRTLRNSPNLESSGLDYKRMEGQRQTESYYRIRVGQWRIGITYEHPDVVVITILSRGDVYKYFPPK